MTGIVTTGLSRQLPSIQPLPDTAGVHLWLASVDSRPDEDALASVLDAHERARAARLRLERDRLRFVHRRAFVRRVLARYLGIAPAQIRIRTSSLGRPELAETCGIHFNASHSDGVVAVTVTRGQPVGVDIERVRLVHDALDLAQGLFAQREVEWLRSIPEAGRSRAFLMLWTRKESVVKAAGGGLSMPLDAFDILDADGRVRWPGGVPGQRSYAFADLAQPEGYVGAVTVAGAVSPHVSTMTA